MTAVLGIVFPRYVESRAGRKLRQERLRGQRDHVAIRPAFARNIGAAEVLVLVARVVIVADGHPVYPFKTHDRAHNALLHARAAQVVPRGVDNAR